MLFIRLSAAVSAAVLLSRCSSGPAGPEVERRFTFRQDGKAYAIVAERKRDSLWWFDLDNDSVALKPLRVPYPVYRTALADMNADGRQDLVLGVVKKTPYDPVCRRRVFMYSIDSLGFHKLWLSSRLAHVPVDFKVTTCDGAKCLHSLELQDATAGRYCIGEYRWHGFGLKWQRFLKSGLSLEQGVKQLSETP